MHAAEVAHHAGRGRCPRAVREQRREQRDREDRARADDHAREHVAARARRCRTSARRDGGAGTLASGRSRTGPAAPARRRTAHRRPRTPTMTAPIANSVERASSGPERGCGRRSRGGAAGCPRAEGRRRSPARHLRAHARVEQRLEQVGDERQHDVERRRSAARRPAAAGSPSLAGVEDQQAEALVVEQALDHHEAADHVADLRRDHGDRRQQRVAQDVARRSRCGPAAP